MFSINQLVVIKYLLNTHSAWSSERTHQRHGPYPLGTCNLKQFGLPLVTICSGCDSVDKTKVEIQSVSELQFNLLLTTLLIFQILCVTLCCLKSECDSSVLISHEKRASSSWPWPSQQCWSLLSHSWQFHMCLLNSSYHYLVIHLMHVFPHQRKILSWGLETCHFILY